MAVGEPLPPEIPGPLGQVIRGAFGSGAPSALVPAEDPKQTFHPQYGPTWGEMFSWVKDHLEADVPAVRTTFGWGDALLMVEQGLAHSITALGSVVSLAIDYTRTLAEDVSAIDSMLIGEIGSLGSILEKQIIDLSTMTDALYHDAVSQIDAAKQWALEQIIAGDAFTLNNANRWATDHIGAPLLEQLGQIKDQLTHYVDAKTAAAVGTAAAFTTATVAPILKDVQALKAAQAAQQALNDECTTPMCEVVGPKTDWGKWLKRFGPLAIWAMLAAVAAEDPHAVESLATELADTLGPVLETWVGTFAFGSGGFPSQPGKVGGAIGGNPLGL